MWEDTAQIDQGHHNLREGLTSSYADMVNGKNKEKDSLYMEEQEEPEKEVEHSWSASKGTENTPYFDNPEERSPSQNLPSETSAQETVNPETQPLTVSEDRNTEHWPCRKHREGKDIISYKNAGQISADC